MKVSHEVVLKCIKARPEHERQHVLAAPEARFPSTLASRLSAALFGEVGKVDSVFLEGRPEEVSLHVSVVTVRASSAASCRGSTAPCTSLSKGEQRSAS